MEKYNFKIPLQALQVIHPSDIPKEEFEAFQESVGTLEGLHKYRSEIRKEYDEVIQITDYITKDAQRTWWQRL